MFCIGNTVDGSVEHRCGSEGPTGSDSTTLYGIWFSKCHVLLPHFRQPNLPALLNGINYPERGPLIPYGNYVTGDDEGRLHQLVMKTRRRIQFSTYHGIRRSPAWDWEPSPLAATPPSPPSSRGVPGRGATQNKLCSNLVTERARGATCHLLGLICHGWTQRRRRGSDRKRYPYSSAGIAHLLLIGLSPKTMAPFTVKYLQELESAFETLACGI